MFRQRRLWGPAGIGFAYLVLFLLTTLFSARFVIEPGALLWFGQAGLDIALLWLFGPAYAPAIFIAHVAGRILFLNSVLQPPVPWEPTLAMAAFTAGTEVLAVGILKNQLPHSWEKWGLREYGVFTFAMVGVALLTSVFRITDYTLFGLLSWKKFFHLWWHGWIATFLGIVNVSLFLLVDTVPFLKRFFTQSFSRMTRRQGIQLLGEATAIPLVLWFCFISPLAEPREYLYLGYIPIIAIALHHGVRGAGLAALTMNTCVMGLVAIFNPAELPHSQLFMLVLSLTGLFLGILNQERLRAEQALRLSEEKYRQVVELSPDAIVVHCGGQVVFVNSAALKMMGVSRPEELLGKRVLDFVFPDFRPLVRERIQRMTEARETVPGTEEKFILPDGRILDVEVAGAPLVYSGKPGVQLVIRDISARKRDEAILKQAEEVLRRDNESLEKLVAERTERLVGVQRDLEKARRLSQIGALATTIAHELRNPLSVIRLAVYNLRKSGPDSQTHLDRIEKKVAESDQSINNLLSYSRAKTPQFQKTELEALLTESLELARAKSGKTTVRVQCRLQAIHGVLFDVDPFQIQEVFQNVLDNAYQAVREEGGEIMVSACEGGPGRIEIEIADNGVGFEAEEAEKLFEPFYTKKSKGTGLGLAICRELVRLQNGEITIEGRKNQGATVHLLLPRQQQEAGAMSR